MSALESLREAIPEWARDLKLNLQSVLQASSLSLEQQWGVAVASAVASRATSAAPACSRWKARRWAVRLPMPGSLESSVTSLWTGGA